MNSYKALKAQTEAENERTKVWEIKVVLDWNGEEQTMYPNFTKPVEKKEVENIAEMQYGKVLSARPY